MPNVSVASRHIWTKRRMQKFLWFQPNQIFIEFWSKKSNRSFVSVTCGAILNNHNKYLEGAPSIFGRKSTFFHLFYKKGNFLTILNMNLWISQMSIQLFIYSNRFIWYRLGWAGTLSNQCDDVNVWNWGYFGNFGFYVSNFCF